MIALTSSLAMAALTTAGELPAKAAAAGPDGLEVWRLGLGLGLLAIPILLIIVSAAIFAAIDWIVRRARIGPLG